MVRGGWSLKQRRSQSWSEKEIKDMSPWISTTWPDNSWLSPVHLVVLLLQFQLFCLQLGNPDLFTGCATLSRTCCFQLSLSTAPAVSTSECSAMKSQLAFTPEVLNCCTLYNHCDSCLTLLVIYERLIILKNNLALNGHVLL
ncbi:hypothetical protein J4Q44_G00279020 [Coregonus suidteri]|uniref:Uncharacterized protein n=1 Tax=Coregonus suidteri TaxID=861788 RepID=A0AAN8QE31_9TELE